MKNEKPLTQNMKDKANACYRLFKTTDGNLTKEQIGNYLGIGNERSVRDIVSLVATKVPIISTSDSKGYKMAKTEQDLEAVEHTWAELSSRIEELQKRIQPLITFREKIKYNIGVIK